MIVQEIKTLDDVLLFEMQQKKVNSLSFSQAWVVCMRAAPYLPFYKGGKIIKRQFASDLLGSIENLENRMIIQTVRRGFGKYVRVLQLNLTEKGKQELSQLVFLRQERLGNKC